MPVDFSGLQKSTVTVDECNNPLGLVSYHDAKNGYWMKINSLLENRNTFSNEGIKQINEYLDGKVTLKTSQDLNAWELPFHDYCGGSSFIYIKVLPELSYSKTEVSKNMLVYTTQGVHGYVTVVVLAKRGNDLIQLTKYLDDKSLYEPFDKACPINTNSSQNGFEESEKCYMDMLLKDTNLQLVALKQAQILISRFAIK